MNKDFTGFKSFYFKSKVILVDDNESFLNNLGFKLSEKYIVSTYTDPNAALDAITSSYNNTKISTLQHFLEEVVNEDDDTYHSVDFTKIKDLSEQSNKEDVCSVVVVDYSMPSCNGLEFCKKIAHLPILKVMLTGHADFKIAVDAFNQGIIDRFLVKDTQYMLEEIITEIKTMQELFFEKLSCPLLTCFLSKKETLLTSKEYNEHLKKIIKDIDAKEFYLLNTRGSYLLINQQGLKFHFITLLNEQLNEYIDLANDMKANSNLSNKLLAKTHAPIFISEDDYKLPISAWDCLLQPIQKANSYYYCLLS